MQEKELQKADPRARRFGDRIIRVERFPPPGITVAQDTVILHGRAARLRGRLIQGIAVLMVLAAIWFMYILWQLYPLFHSSGGLM